MERLPNLAFDYSSFHVCLISLPECELMMDSPPITEKHNKYFICFL